MIKSFSAQNYRNLRVDELALCPVNVFIGPNNSGKSNLIDALSFLPDMLNADTRESAFLEQVRKRGWNELLNRSLKPPGKVSLRWTFQLDEKSNARPFRYELDFTIDSANRIPVGFHISSERLLGPPPVSSDLAIEFTYFACHRQGVGLGLLWSTNPEDSAESTRYREKVSPKDTYFRQTDSPGLGSLYEAELKGIVERCSSLFRGFLPYLSTYFDLRAAGSAQEIDTTAKELSLDGANFVNVLGNLDDEHNFLPTYEERLREVLPTLKRIKIPLAGESYRLIDLDLGGQRFKMRELSDGTKKLMLLALLLHSPSRPRLLAIDEPELNLHPAWLQVVGRWIQSAGDTQLFVSTHSPDLLDSFTEGFVSGHVGIYVCDSQKAPQVSRLSLDRVKTQLAEGWKLGDLYRIGEPLLGGWPI